MSAKQNFNLWRKKFFDFIMAHQFPAMLTAVLLVTALLTLLNIVIYTRSGTVNIDLSRPGYETARQNVSENVTETDFAPNGPITKEVRDDFIERLEKLQTEMSQMNDFAGDSLSDKALNLE